MFKKIIYTFIFKLIAILTLCLVLIKTDLFSFNIPDLNKEINYTIDDINFNYKGDESFSNSVLLETINLPKRKYFDRNEFSQDMQRLKKFYFDHGFFNAVIDTAVIYDTEEKSVDITFTIIENTRYRFYVIEYKGLNNLSPYLKSLVFENSLLKKGEYYDKDLITRESNRILDLLQDNGYLNARLDSVDGTVVAKYLEKFQDMRDKVDVILSFIGLEKIYYFGSTQVEIQKNKYQVQDYVILRQMTFKAGEIYSKRKVIDSERNLTKIAIIQTGRVQIDTIIENHSRVNFVVTVTLNTKYTITPNLIGVNIDNQFFGGAGVEYADKYFNQGGTVFSLSLEGLLHSWDVNRAELKSSLYQPYFFTNKITANYNINLGYYNLDKTFQYTYLRNLLRFNYYIADFTFYNSSYADWTLDLLRVKYKNQFIEENGDTIKQGSITNLMNSVIGLTIIHNNTNDFFNPSSGFFHSITVENAGLIPRIISLFNRSTYFSQYVKFYIPNNFYFKISSGLPTSILATNIEIGNIIEYGRGENIVPVSAIYKFSSGGSSSLRGWNAKDNGILDNLEDGGDFLLEGSLEYRWKTFSNYKSFVKNFWTVYFLDWGNVWETNGDFRFDQIALALGFGLRYETFVGPIRLDLGFQLYNPSAPAGNKWLFDDIKNTFKEHKYAIHFGLGNAF